MPIMILQVELDLDKSGLSLGIAHLFKEGIKNLKFIACITIIMTKLKLPT